eukprot:scaffold318746_cov33-Tisochrysis_lutea.AAC.3
MRCLRLFIRTSASIVGLIAAMPVPVATKTAWRMSECFIRNSGGAAFAGNRSEHRLRRWVAAQREAHADGKAAQSPLGSGASLEDQRAPPALQLTFWEELCRHQHPTEEDWPELEVVREADGQPKTAPSTYSSAKCPAYQPKLGAERQRPVYDCW